MNPIEARAALDSIDDVQRDLALKATYCPPWRHAAFGAVMALLVLGQGFDIAIMAPLFAVAMLAVVLLVADDRRRYGLFINGYRKGRTLPVTLALLGAAIAFGVAVAASIAWSRIYRRELLKGTA